MVCSNSTPCVFEVLSDPNETRNLVHSPSLPPGLVATMTDKLKSFAVYSPLAMTREQLNCYNCTGEVVAKGWGWWWCGGVGVWCGGVRG